MSYWKSYTFKVIKAMKATGNRPGLIQQWVTDMVSWAQTSDTPDAKAIKAWAPQWRHRPFYTAAELAPLFPVLALALKVEERYQPPKSPARLENELRFGGLPVVQNADGSDLFQVHGKLQRLFAVERLHHWKRITLSQTEVESML